MTGLVPSANPHESACPRFSVGSRAGKIRFVQPDGTWGPAETAWATTSRLEAANLAAKVNGLVVEAESIVVRGQPRRAW